MGNPEDDLIKYKKRIKKKKKVKGEIGSVLSISG